MSDNINFDYKNLSPFKWFVLENFPFIEADFDALTEWQLFCKLGKEINKIIDSQNIVGEQAETLTNAFNILKNYVDNYFNNLDVQDEINNKLNEMVEDGTLQEIITQYLQVNGVLCFNTLNELKNATNLIDGSFARTFGKITYNDGEGELYKIRTFTSSDVVDNDNIVAVNFSNTLIAEKQKNKSINDINLRLDLLESEYTVIIGDSFIAQYQENNNWGVYLRELLGLSSTNCLIIGEGGAGFYQVGNQGTNWKGLLQANISRIPDLSKVKRIIVGGGTNDVNSPDKNTLLTSISSFHNYCLTNFPNAHIYVAEFGYFMKFSDVLSRDKINSIVIPAYKVFSNLENSSYLNTELCYRDVNLYNTPSEHYVHPNDNGQHTIASAINQALHGQYLPAIKKSPINFSTTDDITAANLTFYDILNNSIHTISMNGNLTLNKRYSSNSSLNLDLGILNNPFIRKSNNNLFCFANFPIRIVSSTNQSLTLNNCRLTIDENGHFILTIPPYAYPSNIENITGIVIQTTFSFDSYNW